MKGNILIVDDEPAALKLLKDILTADGYAVRPFNNGDLALRSIMVEAPELILLDIRMPGMDGFEVCRRIKEDERLKEIPVIFISAASDMEDKVRAFQEGGVDYITKPFQKEEVVARVKTHITMSQLAEQKLAASYRRLQLLTLHLDNVREEERVRISRELHDEMGSTLTALKMCVYCLASGLPVEMTKLVAETKQIDELVAAAIHTMHHVASQLRPALLNDLGFAAAVERYVLDFQKQTGIECELALPNEGVTLDENQSSALFRILQESMNNVAKHAQATRLSILFINKNHSLILMVKDDGVGFDRNTRKDNSFGLLGIRERALMVNGKARICSKPGKGAQVVVSIPLAGK